MHGIDPAGLISATSATIASSHVSIPQRHRRALRHRFVRFASRKMPRFKGHAELPRAWDEWAVRGVFWSVLVKGGQAPHRCIRCLYSASARPRFVIGCSYSVLLRRQERQQTITRSFAYLIRAVAAVSRIQGPLLTSGERGAEGVLGLRTGACTPYPPPFLLLRRFDLREF